MIVSLTIIPSGKKKARKPIKKEDATVLIQVVRGIPLYPKEFANDENANPDNSQMPSLIRMQIAKDFLFLIYCLTEVNFVKIWGLKIMTLNKIPPKMWIAIFKVGFMLGKIAEGMKSKDRLNARR